MATVSLTCFYYVQTTYTLLRCSNLYRRTYAHAHTEVAVSVFKTHWEAQPTYQYIHKFLKEKKNSSDAIHMIILTTILLPFVSREHFCTLPDINDGVISAHMNSPDL